MKDKKHIGQEVEKTLNSLDGVQRATATPYLFTRVQSRLEKDERNFWSVALGFISRPRVALAATFVTICVSTVIFLSVSSEPSPTTGEGEQIFANEYNLAANTIYDSTIEPE